MTRKNYLLAVALLSLLLAACSKEKSLDPDDNNAVNPLIGDWKFISLHVTGQSVVEVNQPGVDVKSVSNFEYITFNNSGTVNITKDKMDYVDLSYSVDTTFRGYYYESNILIDSFDFPLVVSLPPSDAIVTYQYIPADSVYFPAGSPMNVGGSTVISQAAGSTFRIENNQLIMTTHFLERRNQTTQGIPQTITGRGISVSTLQKL